MADAPFNQNRLYSLSVEARLVSQDWARKTSTIYWEITVERPPNPDWWAWSTTNMGNRGKIRDVASGHILWENPNIAYDFRTNAIRWVFASGQRVIQHNSDGTGRYNLAGDMYLINIGSAYSETGWTNLPRLANIPEAPVSSYINAIAQDSMSYVFSGRGNGGAAIIEWQVEWGLTGSGPFNKAWSNGRFTPGNLRPGTGYSFRARGRNAAGWGPWSEWMRARTLAGARVLYNGVWRDAIPYVKHNGQWKPAISMVKHNGIWKKGQ